MRAAQRSLNESPPARVRPWLETGRRLAALCVIVGLVAVFVAACGGSSKSKTTTSETTQTHGTTTGKKQPALPLQQVVSHVKGAKPGNSANVTPGGQVAIIVRTPVANSSNTVHIAIDRTDPQTFAVTTQVVGTSLQGTSQIHASTAGLQIASLNWKCIHPGGTFCPIHVIHSSGAHVQLSLKSHGIPVELAALFNTPGATRAPQLLPLGLPAPGSPVQATVQVTAVAPKTGSGTQPKPPPLGSSVTAKPGDTVQVLVRLQPGAPSHGVLRIAIPHTSGKSISIAAGGTAQQPSSTATVTSGTGHIRVLSLIYGCELPPGTFCPFTSASTTSTGFVVTMPTPQVPVALTLLTATA